MANEKNLIPFTSEQSREEAAKNGRKGGIASGESRRAKKSMAELARMIAEAPATANDKKKIQSLGIEIRTRTNKTKRFYKS